MTRIYLIRHAEAEGNLYRIAHGHEEGLITDYRGPRQIRALAQRFRDIPVDAVYASDLIRTQTTAQAIYMPKGLPLHPDPAFREIGMGVWEGLTWRQIETRWPLQLMEFNRQLDRWHVEGCETARMVLDRYLPALRRVALPQEQCPHRRVVQLPLQPLRPVDQQQAPGTAGPDYPQLDAPPGQLMLILTEEGRGAGLRAAPGDQVGGLDARHGRSPVVGQGALQIQLSVVHGRPPSWLAVANEHEKKKRAVPSTELAEANQ